MITHFILDNGHGQDTPGKRSPEFGDTPQILEWEFNRRVVKAIAERARALRLDVSVLVPEEDDIPLGQRINRVNRITKIFGKTNTVLISVHANAASTPQASGWEVHTYLGKSESDNIANVFWDKAKQILPQSTKMRGDTSDGDHDFDSNFAILRGTSCPAILTENLFMTNHEDVKFLNSEEGFNKIVELHLRAMEDIALDNKGF